MDTKEIKELKEIFSKVESSINPIDIERIKELAIKYNFLEEGDFVISWKQLWSSLNDNRIDEIGVQTAKKLFNFYKNYLKKEN